MPEAENNNGRKVDFIDLPAKREAFEELRGWLIPEMDRLGVSDKIRKKMLIVADEIFTNIAEYSYPKGNGMVHFELENDPEECTITLVFKDTGVPFNPLEAKEPDISAPLEERKVGGMGIFMVKRMMDSIEYSRQGDCNVLTMKKKIAEPRPA